MSFTPAGVVNLGGDSGVQRRTDDGERIGPAAGIDEEGLKVVLVVSDRRRRQANDLVVIHGGRGRVGIRRVVDDESGVGVRVVDRHLGADVLYAAGIAHDHRVRGAAVDVDRDACGGIEDVDHVARIEPGLRVDDERRGRIDVKRCLAVDRLEDVTRPEEEQLGDRIRGEECPLLEMLQLEPAFSAGDSVSAESRRRRLSLRLGDSQNLMTVSFRRGDPHARIPHGPRRGDADAAREASPASRPIDVGPNLARKGPRSPTLGARGLGMGPRLDSSLGVDSTVRYSMITKPGARDARPAAVSGPAPFSTGAAVDAGVRSKRVSWRYAGPRSCSGRRRVVIPRTNEFEIEWLGRPGRRIDHRPPPSLDGPYDGARIPTAGRSRHGDERIEGSSWLLSPGEATGHGGRGGGPPSSSRTAVRGE
jgi:hypothetical protein